MDPVCHMEVDEATARRTSEYQGVTYYFCAPGCKASFDAGPEKYINGEPSNEGREHYDQH